MLGRIRISLGRATLAGLFIASLGLPAHGEIYRWTDERGRERFSQDLDQVPAAQRAEAERRASDSAGRINLIPSPKRRAVRKPAAAAKQHPAKPDLAAGFRSGSSPLGERPGGKGEAWWRTEWRRHVSAVAAAARRVTSIEESSAAPSNVEYSRRARRGNKERQRYERNRQRRDNQRARAESAAQARAELAAAELRKSEFAETARRAGVPPGWIRE